MKTNLLITNLIVILMFTYSCASYKREFEKTNLTDKTDIHKILFYASLAGSSHNTQPWKAEIYGSDSIFVYADTTRLLPVVDSVGKELYISIGAFIENMKIAANCLGYKTTIQLTKFDSDKTKPIAIVKLYKSEINPNKINLTDIELRTTLRIPFDTNSITNSEIAKLQNIDSNNIYFFASNTTKGKLIAENEYLAYAKQAQDEQAKEELAKWIRFSNKDAKEKSDGLTTAGMGIKGLAGFFVRNFLKPEDSKSESFVTTGIEKTKQQVENCGGWIIITQENENLLNYLNVGRLYEQLNIICQKMNLGFHPMNQIIEEENYYKITTDNLQLNGKIMFVARIGYVKKYPKPVSLRRPVEQFAVFK